MEEPQAHEGVPSFLRTLVAERPRPRPRPSFLDGCNCPTCRRFRGDDPDLDAPPPATYVVRWMMPDQCAFWTNRCPDKPTSEQLVQILHDHVARTHAGLLSTEIGRRARQLLFEHLTDEQIATYQTWGYFDTPVLPRMQSFLRCTNLLSQLPITYLVDLEGTFLYRYCVNIGYSNEHPLDDNLLAFALAAQNGQFLNVAIPAWRNPF